MLNFYSANYTSTESASTKKILTRAMARRKRSASSYPHKDKSGQVLKTEHNFRLAIDLLPKGHAQTFVGLLYRFARRGKVCYMSRETIAREIGTSPKYITQLSNKLAKSGLVHKIDRGTTHQTNIYSLNLDALLMVAQSFYPPKQKIEILPNAMAKLISIGHIKGDELASRCTYQQASPCPKDWPHLRTKKKEIYINTSPTSPHEVAPKDSGEGFTQMFINRTHLPPCVDFVAETPRESISPPPGYEDIPPPKKARRSPISDRSEESFKELDDCRKMFGKALKILGQKYDEGEEVRFYRAAVKKGAEGVSPFELAAEFEKCATLIKNDPTLRSQTTTIFRLFKYEEIFGLVKHACIKFTNYQKTKSKEVYLQALAFDRRCTIKEAVEYLRIGENALKHGYTP